MSQSLLHYIAHHLPKKALARLHRTTKGGRAPAAAPAVEYNLQAEYDAAFAEQERLSDLKEQLLSGPLPGMTPVQHRRELRRIELELSVNDNLLSSLEEAMRLQGHGKKESGYIRRLYAENNPIFDINKVHKPSKYLKTWATTRRPKAARPIKIKRQPTTTLPTPLPTPPPRATPRVPSAAVGPKKVQTPLPTPLPTSSKGTPTASSATGNSPLEILGLSPTATQKQIRTAYLKLVRIYHPDKDGDKENFGRIQAAYNSLIGKGIDKISLRNRSNYIY